MFDFGVGYSELFVLAVVAIIVIGPKDLPRVLRTFGQFMNKARGFAREFQGHVDAAMKEAGVDELKRDLNAVRGTIGNPVLADEPPAAAKIAMPLGGGSASTVIKDFETLFDRAQSQGETRVGGNLVVGS